MGKPFRFLMQAFFAGEIIVTAQAQRTGEANALALIEPVSFFAKKDKGESRKQLLIIN
jgi:hypothetical protein